MLFGVPLLAVLATVFYQLSRSVKLCRLISSQCRDEWSNLQSLLSSRHLIVSHLLDVLPDQDHNSDAAIRLEIALATVRQEIAEIDANGPSEIRFHRIGFCERGMLRCLSELKVHLGDTLDQAKASSASSSDRAIQACFAAIEAGDPAINDSKSSFNGISLTHQSHLCSKFAVWGKRLGFKSPHYGVVNIQWHGSDSDMRHGSDEKRKASDSQLGDKQGASK